MRIAVTKGAGFIGSHLTTRLLELGPRLIVIDNLSTGKRKNLNPQSSLSVSVEDPLKDAAVDVMGTHNRLPANVRADLLFRALQYTASQ